MTTRATSARAYLSHCQRKAKDAEKPTARVWIRTNPLSSKWLQLEQGEKSHKLTNLAEHTDQISVLDLRLTRLAIV